MSFLNFIIVVSYGILFTGGCQPMLAAWEKGDWDVFFSKSVYLGLLTFYAGVLYFVFNVLKKEKA